MKRKNNVIIFKPFLKKKARFYARAGKYVVGPFPKPQQAVAAYKLYANIA